MKTRSPRKKTSAILQSWIDRRSAMRELADLTLASESWTAAQRATHEACVADLQVAMHEELSNALKLEDPASRYGALHAVYSYMGQAKEAAQYARLESELVNLREQRDHDRSVAALETVEDVPAAIRESLEALPAADLVALRDELGSMVAALGG